MSPGATFTVGAAEGNYSTSEIRFWLGAGSLPTTLMAFEIFPSNYDAKPLVFTWPSCAVGQNLSISLMVTGVSSALVCVRVCACCPRLVTETKAAPIPLTHQP